MAVAPARGDVQFVGSATNTVSTAGATLTITGHTVPIGTDRVLVVTVAMDNRSGTVLSGITWNGTENLTKLREDTELARGGRAHSQMWYLVAPTETTANVVVTWAGSPGGKPRMAGALNFVGVDQVNPFDGTGAGAWAQTTGPATVDITTSAIGDMCVDVFCGYKAQSAPVTVGALQTSRWQNGINGTEWGGSSTEPGATGTVTMSWNNPTSAGGNLWTISSGNLNAAAAGGVCGDGTLDAGEDCDDNNTVGGDCCSATCTFETLGSTCSDGSACTVSDTCDGAGTCSPGAPPNCAGAGDQCNSASCSLAGLEGNCDTLTPINEGLACNDGLACNSGETCQTGTCTGGAAVSCAGTGDQCNADSTCDPAGIEGNCDTAGGAINEGLACNDADACNVGETCQIGVCVGGAPPNCAAAGDQCNSASCSLAGVEGNCDTLTPINEGLACNDANACNVGETCQTGTCAGGAPPNCAGAGDQCNSASCSLAGAEGNCDTLTPINEGLACNDGLACNVGETCQVGACTGGAAPNCSAAGDQCNSASCSIAGLEGNCDTLSPINEGLACNDGDVCNVGETCQIGVCTGSAPPDCSAAGDQCNSASCSLAGLEGNCDTLSPINEGLACNDGSACNVGETCQVGACTGGAPPDCSAAGDQCNSASCSLAGLEGNCDTLTPINEGLACNDGDVCNIGETCQVGVCTGSVPPNCAAAGDQCNSASCSLAGVEGNCDTLTPINEGLACNDADACNVGETCQTGTCAGGAPPNCAAAGDQCNSASCSLAGLEGNCDTLTPINEGLACDDTDACNVGETCQVGSCAGGAPPNCAAAGDQCNSASCSLAGLEGNCDTLTPINEGLACNDADACNVGETCQTGACAGGTAQDCSASGDQCNSASCSLAGAEGNCDTLAPINEGLACNDANACNVGETCQVGACTGGAPPNCAAAGDQCNAASCDLVGAEGNCDTLTPINEGLACNDGNACNLGETCQVGACTGGTPPDCSAAGDQCNTAMCNPAGLDGNCDTLTPILDGTLCNDGLFCTATDTCMTGMCIGTGDPCPGQSCDETGNVCADCIINADCNDANSCTLDVCTLGVCSNTATNEGLACDDGNPCNAGETCQIGVCTGGAPPDCSAAGDQCNAASCSLAGLEGNCDTIMPINEGLACNDGVACNVGETCQIGVCTGGAPADCSAAGDQCTAATCDVAGLEGNCDTITPINEGLACNDTNACNVGETCQTGVCTGGAPPNCAAAGDQCNSASCDLVGAEGNCDTLTPINEGLACNDTNACNVGETCQIGVCAGGAAQDCSAAGDQCNSASCSLVGAEGNCDTLTPINEGLACNDANACNVGETCQLGICAGGTAPDCSAAGDQCNSASCNVAGLEGNCDTLTPINEGLACNDANVCNVGETCQVGACTGGAPPDCSAAGDQCNSAFCSGIGLEGNCDSLLPTNEGLSCDDSNACNVGETCQVGACTGGAPPDCSAAGDQCNSAFCSGIGVEGNCDSLLPINEGLACDDVNACNVGETCQAGVCAGGMAPDCSAAGDQCNSASCDVIGLEGNCDTLTAINEGLACNDANVCNVGETCQTGVCAGGMAPDCSAAGDQCNSAACSMVGLEGNCDTLTPINEGLACNDANVCNVGETCQTGVCLGGAAPDCSAAGDQCNSAACSLGGLEGNCDTLSPINEGLACNDGLTCSILEVCTLGTCAGDDAACLNRLGAWSTGLTLNVPGGNNRLLMFMVAYEGGADVGVTTITYGGQALTRINGVVAGTTIFNRVELWYLDEAGISAATGITFIVTYGGFPPANEHFAVATYNNVDQTLPIAQSAVNTTELTTPNPLEVTLTVVEGTMSVGAVSTGGTGTYTWGNGWTEGTDQLIISSTSSTADHRSIAAGTDTASPTHTAPNRQVIVATALTPRTPDCLFDIDCDDANTCTTDVCMAGVCMFTDANEGLACDDGDACNLGETCQLGVCTGGAPPDCSAAGDQCNAASCDPIGLDGNCDTLTPSNEGLACNDADACNIGETCQLGICAGGAAPDCSAAGDQCNTASCSLAGLEGNCDTLTPANEGLACDDADACNVGETCQTGVCLGGAAPDCSAAGDQCNSASCSLAGLEGNCDTLTPTNEGLACNDGSACNVGETCQVGVCTGGAGQDCTGAGDQCNTASCSLAGAEGNCDTLTPANEGLVCNDGLACNIGETCQLGTCLGGAPPDCSAAGDQCNAAACDPAGLQGNCDTLAPANEGLACDNVNACNVGETCQLGVCTGGVAQDCSGAGDQCNTASCSLGGLEGNCDTLTPVANGTACDDGVACTDAVCTVGACSFSANTGQITVNVEAEGLSNAVTRNVTYDITLCGGPVDTRVIATSFDVTGSASVVLTNVDANSEWLAVTEGHTMRRLSGLTFTACAATVNATGVNQLIAGDFHTPTVVTQDNFVDITDFSVLASGWNTPVDANFSTFADITGDGLQGTADFTVLQINFLSIGDAISACPLNQAGGRGDGLPGIGDDGVMTRILPQRVVPVNQLTFEGADRADLNRDGWIDMADIRMFARKYNLPLLPEFERKMNVKQSRTNARSRR